MLHVNAGCCRLSLKFEALVKAGLTDHVVPPVLRISLDNMYRHTGHEYSNSLKWEGSPEHKSLTDL